MSCGSYGARSSRTSAHYVVLVLWARSRCVGVNAKFASSLLADSHSSMPLCRTYTEFQPLEAPRLACTACHIRQKYFMQANATPIDRLSTTDALYQYMADCGFDTSHLNATCLSLAIE